jgi:hypothetical protein
MDIEANCRVRLVFSGDLGRWGRPILRDPELVTNADILLIESTYGGRIHARDPAEHLAKDQHDGHRVEKKTDDLSNRREAVLLHPPIRADLPQQAARINGRQPVGPWRDLASFVVHRLL